MLISAANRVRSIAIITGRLRRNSTHGPSGTATAAPAASPAALTAATSPGPQCSTRIAIRGNAPNPNPEPYALTAYAAQSQPNCLPSDRRATLSRTPAIKADAGAADQTTAPPASHNGGLCR